MFINPDEHLAHQDNITREKKANKKTPSSKTTSIKLKLQSLETYELTVQASYNQTLSAESKPYTFEPVTQTKIGPTNVSLLGCGNCIQVNMSFPEADRSAKLNESMKTFYGARFVVSWWKPEEEGMKSSMETKETSITLTNLQNGTEYCVQVETQINTNKNTEPSALKCIFTGIVEPSRGTVAAFLIVGIGVVTTSMFGLYYTGFLCKLKATLPRALIEDQSQGYTLTPERTIPDNISVSAGRQRPKKPYNGITPQPATRGADSSDEDEDEEGKMYMNRGFSSGENSCQDSVDVSGNSKVSASGGSGSLTGGTQVPDTVLEIEAPHGGGLDEDEPKAEGAEVSFLSDGTITGEVEEEQVCESSGNINLFSVTLAALAVCEEEEHNTRDSPTDLLQLSDLEPLLHTHSQTESDDQTAMASLLPTQEDITEVTLADTFSGCLNTCDGEMQHEETKEEEEDEEEEEEEFCGYMQH
ncbi:Interferon alpha/beta receptor 2 [Dissostichus eleginoides]|uniref:Interferon alpha/beta receptor 2 n=1 Tax=Dissostichus eleginoides TaxID=100907 RepID=A0AAD9CK20_DISEL|nr:Interferon alpha/beta receptor 2 [Dissostichus eleginoides]